MNNFEEDLNSLSKEFKNSYEYKEYMRLKPLFENDKELKDLRLNIAKLTSEGKKEEKDRLLEIYNNHPLVVNFEYTKEALYSTIRQMIQILSD